MNNQSILVSIQQSVNEINWKTPLLKEKALKICTAMFNQFLYDKERFSVLKGFAQHYFTSIIPARRDLKIKDVLIANGILECDDEYKFTKNANNGIPKGYRFNPKFFATSSLTSTAATFTYSTATNNSSISLYCPHEDPCFHCSHSKPFSIQSHFKALLERLTFSNDIDTQIKTLSEIQAQNLTINENITDQFVYLTLNKKEYRYPIKKALKLANETGCDLIQFKDKCYLDDQCSFIENKFRQLNISYCQSIFNIKNNIFYCDRNDTNNRFDYNLTGLKKELFENTLFDGEKLVELDIANAQFAIAAHLNTTIDANFIENAQRGSLYLYTGQALNLSTKTGKDDEIKKAAKALMFRVAFDKVKSNTEFTQLRSLFPKYMSWADGYKKKHGYKMFANLLQKKEAEIMIDGLLMYLISRGYEVFTIHDALRVKESQADEIKTLMNEYFQSIGFKCLVR